MGLRVYKDPARTTTAQATYRCDPSGFYINSRNAQPSPKPRSSSDSPPPATEGTLVSPSATIAAASSADPCCDMTTFTEQRFTHVILGRSPVTALLAVRMGQLLAASNSALLVGVVACHLSPRSISRSAPINLKILTDSSVAPKLLCAGSSSAQVMGVQFDDPHHSMVGVSREAIVCCEPGAPPNAVASMLAHGSTSPRLEVAQPVGAASATNPGRGLTAAVKDLRIAPVRNYAEADAVARWVLEAFAGDARK